MTPIDVPNSSPRRGPRRFLRFMTLLILASLLGLGAWTWLTLSWAYSDGERAGFLQKFERKGWLCKTREGEIALYYGGGQYLGPGTSPQLWDFSVRDPAVAAALDKAAGHRVQLHYTEHPGIPTTCFAETRYFVDRVTDEQSPGLLPAAPTPAAPDAPGTSGASGAPGTSVAPGQPASPASGRP